MSFLDNITKLFNSKVEEGKILGVDIGSSSIKIVQLSLKKGVAVLDTFGEISLAVYANKEVGKPVNLSEDKYVEALKDLMKESQVDATSACFAIPLKSTLMFNLKLPKTIEKSKLNDVVMVEARKYIPVPITEVQLDWSVIPATSRQQEQSDHYDILVVAIHKETINKYANIATNTGLTLKFLEIETFATIRSVVKHERNTTAIVDIGSSITKFYIVEKGVVKKSHVINIGYTKSLKESEATPENPEEKVSVGSGVSGNAAKLLRETIVDGNSIPLDITRIISNVKKAILEYQRDTKSDVPEVVFTGGGSLFDHIISYVEKELSVKVLKADPFSKVQSPAFLDDALRDAGPEFAVAIGIALRGLRL
ncbi:hypothetical protein CSB11_01605 [Candidatus Campbellbacteria bacterium]|nr:MAG: hypothetical protein CSB11_01605 [Candidatus Campbellbacteria bacterium]